MTERITEGTLAGYPVDCVEARRVVWDMLDRVLPAAEAAAVQAHLDACSHCDDWYRLQRQFLAAVGEAEPGSPAGLEALAARVRAALAAER